jgi:hypothetical protein
MRQILGAEQRAAKLAAYADATFVIRSSTCRCAGQGPL